MHLFDSHAHIDDKSYRSDFTGMLERASAAGVRKIMVVGINGTNAPDVIALAEKNPGLFASVGVHPHDASTCSETVLDQLSGLAAHPRVRAWGETGLDFNRMHSPAPVQEKWLIRQIYRAHALDLPLIFHERDSGGRFLDILNTVDNPGPGGVVHCFSGTRQEMFQYLDLGYHIGVTGIVTLQKRGACLRELIPHIPEDRILIETDAPYLTPAPIKNKTRRNEPAFVAAVLYKLAEILDRPANRLAPILWNNTHRLYRIQTSEADLKPAPVTDSA